MVSPEKQMGMGKGGKMENSGRIREDVDLSWGRGGWAQEPQSL